jgi:hypothetical protein
VEIIHRSGSINYTITVLSLPATDMKVFDEKQVPLFIPRSPCLNLIIGSFYFNIHNPRGHCKSFFPILFISTLIFVSRDYFYEYDISC